MAISTVTKHQNFASRYLAQVQNLLIACKELKELRTEWDSQAYSSGIVDSDFASSNAQLSSAILASAVTSVQAVTDLLSEKGNAHYGNLYKLLG